MSLANIHTMLVYNYDYEYESLRKLKEILEKFKVLSGLACNVEKSFVMRIGDESDPVDQAIIDIGFPFTEELTILGFKIRNNSNQIASNYEGIRTKVSNIIRFWERFNLTVPGKITIYKTLLLPQINFIATVLTPDEYYLSELEKMMENFVTKGLSLSKKRVYMAVSEGCLGLFKLENFISALQCSWIRRAKIENDNWKATLKKLGDGDVLNVKYDENLGLGLGNICKSFCRLKEAFYAYGNNFLFDKLYCNARYKIRDNALLDYNFFGP